MLNIESGEWDYELFELLGIPFHMLPEVAQSPAVLGPVPAEEAPHEKLAGVPVVISACHDTAAASAALAPVDKGLL